MFESGLTFDFGQLLIDNEMAKLIKRFITGVPVNAETLAVDLIHEIGPKGDFLSCDHTMKHMHETSTPKLFDRRVRVEWEADGGTTVYERATKEAARVLAEHVVEPLPQDVTDEMDAVIAKFEDRVGVA
jgi:trimethylamine---corrinoid protein Co-methyltransferase